MGTVILPLTDHWLFLYMSPYTDDRKLCAVKYKQSHQGGQIFKKKEMLRRHPKIKGFAMSKLVAAYVLQALRNDRGLCVASEAVERELSYGKKSFGNRKAEMGIDYYVQHHCNYTLVTHAVGFHFDQGKKGNTNFLENRIVVVADRNMDEPNIPEGRSIHSYSKFEYALLDWPD